MRKKHTEQTASQAAAVAGEPANDQQSAGAVFTVPELARRWKCSRHTIADAIRAGRLQAFKVGERTYRVREAEALRYEQQHVQPAVAS